MPEEITSQYLFDHPGHYQIRVLGALDQSWVDHLQGLKISTAAWGHYARVTQINGWLDNALQHVLGQEQKPDSLEVMDAMLKVMSAHVTLQPSGRDFFVEGNDTLLEAALKAGLALNYGCSGGNCGLCKARVISGQVMKTRHFDYILTEAEKQQGYTLMCAHTAVSDITIEALEASDVGHVGAGENLDAASQMAIRVVRGLRVGVLALAEHEFGIAYIAGPAVKLTVKHDAAMAARAFNRLFCGVQTASRHILHYVLLS